MRKFVFFLVFALVGFTLTAQSRAKTVSKNETVRVEAATMNAATTNEQPSVISVTRADGTRAERIQSVDLFKQSETTVLNVPDRGGNRNITTFPWSENFNGATFPPTDWLRVQQTGTGNWVQNASGPSPHDGTGAYAWRSYSSGDQSTFLITPEITLPASGVFELSFMSYIGDPSYYDTDGARVMMSTTGTAPADFTTVVYLLSGADLVTSWQKLVIDMSPYLNQTFYLAFQYQGNFAHMWGVDDVTISEKLTNDLSIAAVYPYSQTPVGQGFSTLSATVTNIGVDPQTNLVLTVLLNGTPIGTANEASLAPGASVTMNVTPSVAIPLGENSLTFTIEQDEVDENPLDNEITRTFIGTPNTYATDNGTMATYWGGSATAMYGNIYEFTQPTSVDQIQAYFYGVSTGAATFGISIHEVTAPNTIDATPLYSQTGFAKGTTQTAWANANIFQTLPAGTYFIAVTGANINILGDNNSDGRNGYGYGGSGTALTTLAPAIFVRANVDLPDDDLQMVANGFPYTKIPQMVIDGGLPFPVEFAGRAVNLGVQPQTNVVTSVTYDGVAMGASTAIPTLAALSTSALMTVSTPSGTAFPTALGTYDVVYTVTQDETDFNPSNNVETYSFEVTNDLYAIDNAVPPYVGVGFGSTAGSRLGNFFTITDQILVTQVEVAFSISAADLASNLILYETTGPLSFNSTPIFTVPFTRPGAGGLITLNVPATELSAGTYFLCIQEVVANTNYGIAYDGVPGRVCYGIAGATGTALSQQTAFGSLAIRMFVADPSTFIDAEISQIITPLAGSYMNLTATEEVTVEIKNNGSAPITGFTLELDLDGTVVATETYAGTIDEGEDAEYTFTATLDLSAADTYVITVTINLAGDMVASNDAKSVTVTNFVCSIVDTFPYEEGFENNATSLPNCWTQEYVTTHRDWNWEVVTSNGTYPSAPLTGTYMARFLNSTSTPDVTKLITRPLDLTGVAYPVLKFWHQQHTWSGDQDQLRVYYKNSYAGEWVLLAEYTESITTWTERYIPLPEATNDYYIAFEGTADYGRGIVLDDITIDAAPAIPMFDGPTTLAFGNVYNNLSFTYIKDYTFKNIGGVQMEVDLVTIDPELIITGLPMTAAPGSTNNLPVELDYSTLPVGAYAGTFEIETDDTANLNVTVNVTANVQAATTTDLIREGFDATTTPAGWAYTRFARVTTGGINNGPAIRANNYSTPTSTLSWGDMTTCFVDMGADPVFSFQYKSTYYSGGAATPGDAISGAAYISNDAGLTWTEVWTLAPGEHVESDDFTFVDIDVSAYANQFCLGRIMLRSGYPTTPGGSTYFDCYHWLDDVVLGTLPEDDLTAVSLAGNLNPTAEATSYYTVRVKNSGSATQTASTYSVKLMQDDVVPVQLVSVPGIEIGYSETKDILIPWTPDAADVGTMTIFGEIDFLGDEFPLDNLTDNLIVDVRPVGDFEIIIGTGTTAYKLPVDLYYRKSLSQTVYYQDELIVGAEISKIKYSANIATAAIPDKHTKVWMGETSLPNLAGGWINPASLTEVFDGDIEYLDANPSEIEIELDQPYIYNGGTLVIYTYKYDSDPHGTTTNNTHFGTAVANSNRSRAYHANLIGEEFDYTDPASAAAGSITHGYPNVKLEVDVTGIGSLSVTVTNGTEPLEGAEIRFAVGANGYTPTNAEGKFFFPYISTGTYQVEVSKPGYLTATETVVITANTTEVLNINLLDDIRAPYNLEVEVEATDAFFTWNNRGGFFDDFESYEDFIISDIGDYTLIDGDGFETWTFGSYSFPHEGEEMSFIIFNPYETTPPMAPSGIPNSMPFSGQKYLACFNADTPPGNNDWFILPKLEIETGFVFEFMARSLEDYNGGERFQIGVSTTGTDETDFTIISDPPYVNINELQNWTLFSFDLSAYAGQEVHVAINCISDDNFVFMVDDIFVGFPYWAKSNRALLGYTIYLDGAEVATDVQTLNYEFNDLSGGNHTAGVKAVYTTGESAIETIPFYIAYYNVTFNTPTNGTLTVSVDDDPITSGEIIEEGTILTIDAEPDLGYHVASLTVNGVDLSGDTYTVVSDTDIECEFAINVYTITAVANPVEGNTVTGGGDYNHGDPVTLVATAEAGVYNFINWTKDGSEVSTDATYNFTALEDADYVANFVPIDYYLLDLSVNPANSGTVTGGGHYLENEVVPITATPEAGYAFINWTEGATVVSTIPNFNYTMPAFNKFLTANFELITYTITVAANPVAGGTVSGGGTYNLNDPVTVVATPAADWNFVNWTKDGTVVSTDATYNFPATEDADLIANFVEIGQVLLTLQADPAAGAATLVGGGSYVPGTVVPVSTTAANGYEFVNWTDGTEIVSTTPSFNYTMPDVNKTLTANFTGGPGIKSLDSSTLSVYPNPANDVLYISSEARINAVSLFDASGRLVLDYGKVNNSELTIDLSGLSSGIYFVRIDGTTVKVVKK